MRQVRNAALICLSLAVIVFGAWVTVGPWHRMGAVETGLTIIILSAHTPGAFWMLYHCIRYEQHPFPYILLAFVPYAFLWYYFERVKEQRDIRGCRRF